MKTPFTPIVTKTGKPVSRNVATLAAKAASHKVVVTHDGPDQWDAMVGSGESGETYEVTIALAATTTQGATRPDAVCTCTCDYGIHRPDGCACSHTLAAMKATIGAGQRIRLFTEPSQAAKSHRPTHYTGDNIFVSF